MPTVWWSTGTKLTRAHGLGNLPIDPTSHVSKHVPGVHAPRAHALGAVLAVHELGDAQVYQLAGLVVAVAPAHEVRPDAGDGHERPQAPLALQQERQEVLGREELAANVDLVYAPGAFIVQLLKASREDFT